MSYSLAVWLFGLALYAVAFGATFHRGLDRGLMWLRWYFLLSFGGNLLTLLFFLTLGFQSSQYVFAYYAVDLSTVIFGFVVLARLVELAFEKSTIQLPRLRLTGILLFTGIAVGSGAMVYLMRGHLSSSAYSIALDQNFSFLGMLLAVLLFLGMNVMMVPGVRFRRVALCFSIMYSSSAIGYTLMALLPSMKLFLGLYVLPFIGLAAIGLLTYSLLVPEQEATVAVPQRGLEAIREGVA
ncbi:MAG: hypothetical protein ACRD1Y_08395 [Terriglobales bacterium]